MVFGYVDPAELKEIDFTLPPDPQQTTNTLKTSPKTAQFELRIGATKWGRKEWLGNFYPAKTKESQFFQEYVKHFDSILLMLLFTSYRGQSKF